MPSPYDQSTKILGDDHPDALLYLIAEVPPGSVAESCDRELNIETLRADHLFRMKDNSLIHVEIYSEYASHWKENQIRKASLIVNKYKLPLRSIMVLMTQNRAPQNIPDHIHAAFGSFQMSLEVEVQRLWQVPARRALDFGNPVLYPWTVMLNATRREEDEAIDRIVLSRNDPLRFQLAMLAELRYRGQRELLKRLLERMDTMTIDEVFKESPLYQRIEKAAMERGLDKGMQQGMEQGMQQGIQQGEKRFLKRFLTGRFGTLPSWAEDRIESASTDSIERWASTMPHATTLEEALS